MSPKQYTQSTPLKKAFNAPFWITLCVASWLTWQYADIYVSVSREEETYHDTHPLIVSGWIFVWPAVLWGEVILYRIIRKNIQRRLFAWLHVWLIVLAFIALQLTLPFTAYIIEYFDGFGFYREIMVYQTSVPAIRLYLAVAAHVFFIVTIVKSFRKKEISAEDNEQAPGILDGIVDEY